MKVSENLVDAIKLAEKELARLRQLADNPPQLPPGCKIAKVVLYRDDSRGYDYPPPDWVVVPSEFEEATPEGSSTRGVCFQYNRYEAYVVNEHSTYRLGCQCWSSVCAEEAILRYLAYPQPGEYTDWPNW